MPNDSLSATPPTISLSFPVWVCVRKANPDSVMGGKFAGGARFVAIFTQPGLAANFLSGKNVEAEAEIREIPEATNLIGFLKTLQADGVAHVLFDTDGQGKVSKLNASIENTLRALEG